MWMSYDDVWLSAIQFSGGINNQKLTNRSIWSHNNVVQWLTWKAPAGWQVLLSGVRWRSWRRGHRPAASAGSAAPGNSYRSAAYSGAYPEKPPRFTLQSPPALFISIYLIRPKRMWSMVRRVWSRFTSFWTSRRRTASPWNVLLLRVFFDPTLSLFSKTCCLLSSVKVMSAVSPRCFHALHVGTWRGKSPRLQHSLRERPEDMWTLSS